MLSVFLDHFPEKCTLVTTVTIDLSWASVRIDREAVQRSGWPVSAIGDLTEFAFADREPLRLELNAKANALIPPLAEREDFAPIERGFTKGPDGSGFLERIRSVHDATQLLEGSILKLPSLRSLCWRTGIIPMTSKLCDYLGQLDTLRNVRIHGQGEYRSKTWVPPQLELLFPPGKEFDIVCLDPSLRKVRDHMEIAGESDDRGLDTDPSRDELSAFRFDWERISTTPYAELEWIEKGLALAARSLVALAKTKTKILFLGGEATAVLRFRETIALSLQLPLMPSVNLASEPGLSSFNAMFREWLEEVWSLWYACSAEVESQQDNSDAESGDDVSPLLSPEDLFDLHGYEPGMQVLAYFLNTDEELRQQVAASWNEAVSQGKHEDRNCGVESIENEHLLGEMHPDDAWFFLHEANNYLGL